MKGYVNMSLNVPRELHKRAKIRAAELTCPPSVVLRSWMVKGAEVENAERQAAERTEAQRFGEALDGAGAGGVRPGAEGPGTQRHGNRAARGAKDGEK